MLTAANDVIESGHVLNPCLLMDGPVLLAARDAHDETPARKTKKPNAAQNIRGVSATLEARFGRAFR